MGSTPTSGTSKTARQNGHSPELSRRRAQPDWVEIFDVRRMCDESTRGRSEVRGGALEGPVSSRIAHDLRRGLPDHGAVPVGFASTTMNASDRGAARQAAPLQKPRYMQSRAKSIHPLSSESR